MCVKNRNSIAKNLENYSKKTVLNLSRDANGPMLEYAILKEYGKLITPKRIIWLYFEGNDLDDINDEINNRILVKYYNEDLFFQELHNRQDEINKYLHSFLNKKKTIDNSTNHMIQYIKLKKIRVLTIEKFFPQINENLNYEIFKNILFKVKNYTELNNIKFYFVYLPEFGRYDPDSYYLRKNYYEKQLNDKYSKIKKITKDLDIYEIDIYHELTNEISDKLSIFPDRKLGHYNETGYDLVSKIILKKINEYEKSH